MQSKTCVYYFITLLLLLLSAILVSCGGGSDTGAVPSGVNQDTGSLLVQKEVSGYIFATGREEEDTQRFVILDSPLSGEDAFLNQVSSFLEEEYPDDWANPETEELFGKLSSEVSGWQPLSEISSAQLFTVYQDSKSESPLSVGEDGYFEGTVMVASTDDLVKFEVVIGKENCYSVETIASSDITASKGETSELRCCPEMILNFPGFCSVFKVHGNGINLKEGGLNFTLNDSSLGYLTPPFYLRFRGKKNYSVAYGIFYANSGFTTPVDSTITASTESGLSLDIFTEVIGSSASIAGHVGGSGVVPVAGFVYSFGCNAFDLLDGEGNYSLPSVFKGHKRTVVAVYWLAENGRLKKYREERTIEFLDGDMVGFDLPEDDGPPPVTDPDYELYYFNISRDIVLKKAEWEFELGYEQGVQKTADWLQGKLSSPELPNKIKNAVASVEISTYDAEAMQVIFTNDMIIDYPGRLSFYREESEQLKNVPPKNIESYTNFSSSHPPITSQGRMTTKNSDVLILGPLTLNHYWVRPSVQDDIVADLEHLDPGNSVSYNVTSKVIRDPNGVTYKQFPIPSIPTQIGVVVPIIVDENNIIRPQNFDNIDEYGIIYIDSEYKLSSFGWHNTIICPLYCETCGIGGNSDVKIETETKEWMRSTKYDVISWQRAEHYLDWDNFGSNWGPSDIQELFPTYTPYLGVMDNYFNEGHDYSGSLVFFHGEQSWMANFADAKVYAGFTGPTVFTRDINPEWSVKLSYYFFYYMMHGYIRPNSMLGVVVDPSSPPSTEPMSAYMANMTLCRINENPMPDKYEGNTYELYLNLGEHNENANTYFPVPVLVEVTEE